MGSPAAAQNLWPWVSIRFFGSSSECCRISTIKRLPTGRRYIIGAPKSELKKFRSELARRDGWRPVREGVEVKLTRHPETDETVILCRSADRRSKEQAMHDRFSRRIEQALERLSARLARSKKPLDAARVNSTDRPHPPAKPARRRRFTIVLEPDGCAAGFRLRVGHDASFDDWAALSEGAYLLRSNIADWSDQQLWKAYIQLTQAEAAFRIQKDQGAFLVYVLPPVPRCSDWASSSLISPSRISLPRNCSRVGLHIVLFEACSAFTRVAARTLARSPIRDPLYRRLQPFRHLHDCSGCFRLERSPGGTCTHWKAPPSHGARK